ncbi:MAG: hypothetical protein HC933_22140 [Pleurocapsa sp. SU_196_0]|nr:hypothetical protein [Pleurocapsa sp. SU_196_0]
MNLLGVVAWRRHCLPGWIPMLWALSTITGFVSFAAPHLEWLFTVSGVLFGVGLAGAGFDALSRSKRDL